MRGLLRRISAPRSLHRFGITGEAIVGPFLPGAGGFFYDPSTGEPVVEVPPPASNDIHYTYTYDVPWDWAHRYPPAVVPSDRPYVSSCPAETVTVRGHDGREQTINVMRCY